MAIFDESPLNRGADLKPGESLERCCMKRGRLDGGVESERGAELTILKHGGEYGFSSVKL